MDKIRNLNKKNIENYIEIFVQSDIKKIIKKGEKKLYSKNKKNIVGVDIIPEFPKNPHIIVKNNFSKKINVLSDELFKKISQTIK